MNIELLERLCETPGLPGREERVRALIESEIDGLFDHVETDPMGNLLCRRDPRGGRRGKRGEATRVMLACHMDEIGFYVRHIDDAGFLRLNRAGGFDPRTLFARRVAVCARDGDMLGVMHPAVKPVHLQTPEDRTKVPGLDEFYVDLGMSAADVKKKVRIGDYVVMHEPAARMGNKLVAKAVDNRYACWLGIESVRALEESGAAHACEVHVAFTVQEEVGLRGAKTAANAIKPHLGIGVDVTLAADTPRVGPEDHVSVQGDGVVLNVMDGSVINDYTLVDELESVAVKHRIKHQRSMLTAGGTDTAAMQMALEGCRTATVSVGIRYIHTVCEMVDVRDLKASVDLLARWYPTVK